MITIVLAQLAWFGVFVVAAVVLYLLAGVKR